MVTVGFLRRLADRVIQYLWCVTRRFLFFIFLISSFTTWFSSFIARTAILEIEIVHMFRYCVTILFSSFSFRFSSFTQRARRQFFFATFLISISTASFSKKAEVASFSKKRKNQLRHKQHSSHHSLN